MIRFKINKKKITQMASIFLRKEDDSITYMKLIKLMYLTDREALNLWERPLTGDDYFSMEDGPVLSGVLDIITHGEITIGSTYWYKHISHPYNSENNEHSIDLIDMPETDELSKRELKLIDEIYEQFGDFSQWDLVNYCHDFCSEWNEEAKEKKTSIALSIKDILEAVDKTPEEIEEIKEEVETLNYIDDLLGIKN